MKTIKLLTALLALITLTLDVKAQQQVTFTQYMFNGMAINPGYIGSHEVMSISALGRWQWAGIEGAPTTQTLAMHTGVPGKNIGLGLQITHDQVAVTDQTSVFLGYSYKIPIGKGNLRMGVQGGYQRFNSNFADLYVIGADNRFAESVSSSKPNFGFGLYYSSPKYYLGLSAPLLLNTTLESGGQTIITQRKHYFMTGGYLFDLSENVKVKPNILIKAVQGAPLSIDYNINFLLKDLLWLGVSYRQPESISLLTEFNVNSNLRVGYAYDHVLNAILGEATNSSHEVLISYRFELFKQKRQVRALPMWSPF